MSALRVQPTRLIQASVALYRALLLLYPARFRRVYGGQMRQVFQTSCRLACREGGLAALARLWLLTLRDLIVTVIAERYEEDIIMERRSLTRAAGLAGLIGGALLLVYALLLLAEQLSNNFALAIQNSFGASLYLMNWAQSLLVPLSWACVIVGLLGLYALLARQRGIRVWLAGALALAGAGLGFLGSLSLTVAQWGSTLGWGLLDAHSDQVMGQQLPYVGALDLNGRLLIGLALLLTPLLLQRGPALKAEIAIVLALGLVALLPYLYITVATPNYIDTHIPMYGVYSPLPRYPVTLPLPSLDFLTPFIWFTDVAFAAIWGIGWLLLGARFLRGRWWGVATQPAPALGMSF